MIDGHIHIERGEYTLDWINQFVNRAVEMQIDEIRLLEHCYRFEEFVPMFPDLTERQTNCGGVMGLRTIMIFPDFENGEIIDKIREKYDPLAKMVRPHITIVFPFDIQLSDEEIEKILDNRLNGIKAFEIEFQGFSKCEDKFGNYLFLEVVRGSDIIEDIHDTLYENEFKKLDLELPYTPHMTVGKLSSVDELNNAYEELKDISCSFSSLIEKISVERIGENEESIIIIEKRLDW